MDDELRFFDILNVLVRHEVEFIVVGGVAAILEGVPIATFDLDIVYRRTDDKRLARGLGDRRRLRKADDRQALPELPALPERTKVEDLSR